MNRQKNFLVASALSCAAILLGVAGCGGSSEPEASPTSVKTQQQQIDEINSNTRMPPAAKAAALAALEQQGQNANKGLEAQKK